MCICGVVSSGAREALTDSGKSLYILNGMNENLNWVKTDDSAFMTQEERNGGRINDFLLHASRCAWLVELKGAKYKDACDQISSGMDLIQGSKHKGALQNKLIRAYIVSPSAKVPNIRDEHGDNLRKKLQKRSNVKDKPKNLMDYLQVVRCVSKVTGNPGQKGPVLQNAANYPLHIESFA